MIVPSVEAKGCSSKLEERLVHGLHPRIHSSYLREWVRNQLGKLATKLHLCQVKRRKFNKYTWKRTIGIIKELY